MQNFDQMGSESYASPVQINEKRSWLWRPRKKKKAESTAETSPVTSSPLLSPTPVAGTQSRIQQRADQLRDDHPYDGDQHDFDTDYETDEENEEDYDAEDAEAEDDASPKHSSRRTVLKLAAAVLFPTLIYLNSRSDEIKQDRAVTEEILKNQPKFGDNLELTGADKFLAELNQQAGDQRLTFDLAQEVKARYEDTLPTGVGDFLDQTLNRVSSSFTYLTFNVGGPQAKLDTQLLDFLVSNNIAATVFVNGQWTHDNLADFAKLIDSPQLLLASFGERFVPLTTAGQVVDGLQGPGSVAEAVDEVMSIHQFLHAATRLEPGFFRSPTGKYDSTAVSLLYALQVEPVGYAVDADLAGEASDAQVAQAFARVQAGDIVMARLDRPGSAASAALQREIGLALARGVQFARLGEV